LSIRYYYDRHVRLDACPPRLRLAMAGRPPVTLHFECFRKGSGIEGKKISKFIQKQRPLGPENFRIPLAEVARHVGVSRSAISKALNRTMKN